MGDSGGGETRRAATSTRSSPVEPLRKPKLKDLITNPQTLANEYGASEDRTIVSSGGVTRNLREDEHISLLISKIKRFNRETNTITFMVAHPTKQIRNADGIFEVKSLYDVSGSSHWNNKADIGVIVTRDFERGQTTVRVAKVREVDVQGNIGEIVLRWNNSTKCYDSLMENKF